MARPTKNSALKRRDIEAIGSALKPLRLSARELTASRERMMEKIHAAPPADTVTVRGDSNPGAESPRTRSDSTARCGSRGYRPKVTHPSS
jgi:hypothetical protein